MTTVTGEPATRRDLDHLDAFYVWDGILAASSSSPPPSSSLSNSNEDEDGADSSTTKVTLKWEGTVVSYPSTPDARSVETAPRRGAFDEFVASEVKFLVEGEAIRMKTARKEENGAASGGGGAGATAAGEEGTFYKATLVDSKKKAEKNAAENGDKEREKEKEKNGEVDDDGGGKKTKETTSDDADSHELLLRTLRWTGNLSDQTANLVFARGYDDGGGSGGDGNARGPRGHFIAAGWMRVGNRLTVGRRYVSDDDPRAEWSTEEVREAVLEEILDKEKGGRPAIPPWRCAVMASATKTLVPNKRRKVSDEDNGADKEGEKK